MTYAEAIAVACRAIEGGFADAELRLYSAARREGWDDSRTRAFLDLNDRLSDLVGIRVKALMFGESKEGLRPNGWGWDFIDAMSGALRRVEGKVR